MHVTSRFQGIHVLGELRADASVLDDLDLLSSVLAQVLRDAGATVLQVVGEKFEPMGATVIAVLAESHASLHTYPEDGLAFFDLFTCGPSADSSAALEMLIERLGAQVIKTEVIVRGVPEDARGSEPVPPGNERAHERMGESND